MRAGLWHTNNQTDSSNSPLFIRVPTLWKLNKVLVPTLPRHTCQAHVPGYPYIQSMSEDTLWFHKNTRCLHAFLSLLMLQMVSTGSKPEPQEMIIPEFSVLRFSAILGHLLLYVHPAGGADSPTGTLQPHDPRVSSALSEIFLWAFFIHLLKKWSLWSALSTAVGYSSIFWEIVLFSWANVIQDSLFYKNRAVTFQ